MPFSKGQISSESFLAMSHDICAAWPHGTFRCGLCIQCSYMIILKEFVHLNGRKFIPHHFVNCSTPGVVYLITCECGDFYVGKTSRPLSRCVYEHVWDIAIGNLNTPWGCDAAFKHGYKKFKIGVRALDHVHPNVRGGDVNQHLLRLEKRWIYDLRATHVPGLNDYIS